MLLKTSDFFYDLPASLIAQTPTEPRDQSRMLVMDRAGGTLSHRVFSDLPDYLRAGDVLVVNRSRVLPARLLGELEGGRPVEVLLLNRKNADMWEALVKPGKKLRTGAVCTFGSGKLTCEVQEVLPDGNRLVRFCHSGIFESVLDELGQMPLPPYITARLDDKERYQTVYARETGSAAAPTAGLHFTPELLDRVRGMGVVVAEVILHVGLGTFRPVKSEDTEDHVMHAEWYEVPKNAADAINLARASGGRVICVGTTSVRTLESCANGDGMIPAASGWTSIFITPGYRFRVTDALITNFHLPESTLLMLVSAFAGKDAVLNAYRDAIAREYRFFSFGDAMLLI